MLKVETKSLELSGTNYEIGHRLGKLTINNSDLEKVRIAPRDVFGKEDEQRATELFDKWCPGLTEEILGFADALAISPLQAIFYSMTYLQPRCSQIALSSKKMQNGHTVIARNYEFSPEAEDFTLVRTSVKGKYTHLGTSVLQFGRDDGMNEHGLGVTMSSCGFPVGAIPYMRNPAIKGLQFWAVIRSLLENCKNVEEALSWLEGMPIAYNLNLMLADKTGSIALVETMDGQMEVKQMNDEEYIHATNHPHLPKMQKLEPKGMRNSVQRYQYIQNFFESRELIKTNELKSILLSQYPKGLCCYYYEAFFGTTKSMIIDVNDGTIELCWGGKPEHGWKKYKVSDTLGEDSKSILLTMEQADPSLFEFITL